MGPLPVDVGRAAGAVHGDRPPSRSATERGRYAPLPLADVPHPGAEIHRRVGDRLAEFVFGVVDSAFTRRNAWSSGFPARFARGSR
ncbi:hypothetical protein ACWCRF_26780 [Streptomyces sp. NPDC002405]|uniref:hypothetical protein n=1 Tax=unclassified Streptomyces TaxID=2593676 RepID=UPI00367752A3